MRSGIIIVNFDGRFAEYPLENLGELELSYASTIHKSQGSEYNTVIIPLLPGHKILLSRNLFYTAVTRTKQRVIIRRLSTWQSAKMQRVSATRRPET